MISIVSTCGSTVQSRHILLENKAMIFAIYTDGKGESDTKTPVFDAVCLLQWSDLKKTSFSFTNVLMVLLLILRRGRWCWSLGGEDRGLAIKVWITADKLNRVQAWGLFLKVPETFSYPESRSKISNLTITYLLYSHVINMNRGSLHTRSSRRAHLGVYTSLL